MLVFRLYSLRQIDAFPSFIVLFLALRFLFLALMIRTNIKFASFLVVFQPLFKKLEQEFFPVLTIRVRMRVFCWCLITGFCNYSCDCACNYE